MKMSLLDFQLRAVDSLSPGEESAGAASTSAGDATTAELWCSGRRLQYNALS